MLPVFSARAKRQRQESHSKTDAPSCQGIRRRAASECDPDRQKCAARTFRHGTIGSPIRTSCPGRATDIFHCARRLPHSFTRDEKIEVATTDGSWSTLLAVGSGGMTLQNSKVAVATLDPAKHSGLRVRTRFGSGWSATCRRATGARSPRWLRLPGSKSLECPAPPRGRLQAVRRQPVPADSVSGDPQFTQPIQVPDGYPDRHYGPAPN